MITVLFFVIMSTTLIAAVVYGACRRTAIRQGSCHNTAYINAITYLVSPKTFIWQVSGQLQMLLQCHKAKPLLTCEVHTRLPFHQKPGPATGLPAWGCCHLLCSRQLFNCHLGCQLWPSLLCAVELRLELTESAGAFAERFLNCWQPLR